MGGYESGWRRVQKMQILHFVQDDNEEALSAACYAVPLTMVRTSSSGRPME